jgi:hypothetical protein
MNSTTPQHATAGERFEEATALIAAPALYGPPVILLLGPWLTLGLVLAPWVGPLIALALIAIVAVCLLAALGALLASPCLLARHLLARHAARRRRVASVSRPAHAASRHVAPRRREAARPTRTEGTA